MLKVCYDTRSTCSTLINEGMEWTVVIFWHEDLLQTICEDASDGKYKWKTLERKIQFLVLYRIWYITRNVA